MYKSNESHIIVIIITRRRACSDENRPGRRCDTATDRRAENARKYPLEFREILISVVGYRRITNILHAERRILLFVCAAI